jgi:predicted ATPase
VVLLEARPVLHSVRIKNFKSIIDAEVILHPITVLIGANNAGKSNFLEVLELISEFRAKTLDNVFAKGGFDDFFPKYERADKGANSMHFALHYRDPGSSRDKAFYSVGLRKGDNGTVALAKEDFSIGGREYIRTSDDGQSVGLVVREPGVFQGLPSPTSQLRLLANDLSLDMFSTMVHALNPSTIKKEEAPKDKGVEISIEKDGAGTVLIVDEITTKFMKKRKRFRELLRNFAPEIEEVTAPGAGVNRRILAITEKGMDEAVSGEHISDGLAFLIAILASLSVEHTPSIIGIEEPENGIHPRRLKDLASYFKQLAEKYEKGESGIPQLILTTHSPYLLDYFEDMPQAVVVVNRDEKNGTTFASLDKLLNEKKEHLKRELEDKTMSLGEMWFNGYFGGVPK